MQTLSLQLENYMDKFTTESSGPRIRNNTDDIKEQIWEVIVRQNPKVNRKVFFIKTSKVPSYELLSIKKWAESTDNFCRSFYGAVKKYNRKIDGLA